MATIQRVCVQPLIFMCVALCLLYSNSSRAEADDKQLWNFDNADIQTVVKRVAEETNKNFIIDPRVQGKVTIISQNALSSDEVYQVFLSMLRVYGFKAIETNNVVKIIPQDSANNDSGRLVSQSGASTDEQVMKVLAIKYLPATEVMTAMRTMTPKTTILVALDSSNHLIIADTQSNINKIEKMVRQIDSKQTQSMDVITLKHASSVEISKILSSLVNQKAGKGAMMIGSDERTNSVILSGGTSEIRAYVQGVVGKLDVGLDNESNSEVIYLRYVQASNIAPIIAAYLEEAMQSDKDEKVRSNAKDSGGIASSSSSSSSGPQQGEDFANHLRGLKNNSTTDGLQGTLFSSNENQPKSGILNRFVQWEETTNAMIIKAPPTIMRAIKGIVAKLDVRRPQVIIDVVIAEVQIDRLEQLGVEWDTSSQADVRFATRFPTGAENGITGNFNGGTVAELGTGLSLGIFRHGSIRALIKALGSDASANILSTPTLMTLDNQTALIKVGEKVPFAIGQTNNQNIGGNPFTSYDREEVGLSLTIKPQIINNSEIKLQIENILSNVVANSSNESTGGNPTTSERTILTNVLVNDGKILALGGLIQDSWQEVQSRVPFLSRLPFIGHLFKSQSKRLVKKNLMIFLRPKIIHNDDRSLSLSTSKYDDMRGTQLRSYEALEKDFIDEPPIPVALGPNDYTLGNRSEPLNPISEVVLPDPFK